MRLLIRLIGFGLERERGMRRGEMSWVERESEGERMWVLVMNAHDDGKKGKTWSLLL